VEIKDIHSVFFIGIGGIGMSALARWFKCHDKLVAGYDRQETPLTAALENEGIQVFYQDDASLIPIEFLDNKQTLVVYTPAVPTDNNVYQFLSDRHKLLKRSQVLGMITKEHYTIAVAGTHGKTTTSTMIAHVLQSSGRNITAFMGGISTNYETNILIGEKDDNELFVVEADEYDRSFLTLHPDFVVITALDADHLDIYGTAENLKKSFVEFTGNISENGKLIMSTHVVLPEAKIDFTTYGLEDADATAANMRIQDGYFTFDYVDSEFTINDLQLQQPGYHNVENAVAAIKACLAQGLTINEVREGISSYLGVKRRFEFILKNDRVVFIDDYAHHPVEIEAFLRSVKALYPEKHITAVFQPHLYTRTRDFAAAFGSSLSLADEVVLLNIYPAREEPIAGVSSQLILDHIPHGNKYIVPKTEILDHLERSNIEILATIGAGDIDQLVHPIKEKLIA
jgi:UDP-N-acetylmuramate--alanine ligase